MRSRLIAFFVLMLLFVKLCAQEYSVGDIFEKDGISYKVLVSYLVIDSKETPDTIYSPNNFHRSGELMAISVSKTLNDVVIPPAVGRFKVVGLTDSLFFEHEHDRIWLPDLLFAGNGCFAKLKLRSGALVLHNISRIGESAFDDLDADLIIDVNGGVTWNNTFTKEVGDKRVESLPKGNVKLNSRSLSAFRKSGVYDNSISASGENFQKWIDAAFNNDAKFQQNDIIDKNARFSKKVYNTMPKIKQGKGFEITVRGADVKKMKMPWGNLTKEYYREALYNVRDIKKKTVTVYRDFIPEERSSLKDGWYVRFIGEKGEEKYMLNGKKLKK